MPPLTRPRPMVSDGGVGCLKCIWRMQKANAKKKCQSREKVIKCQAHTLDTHTHIGTHTHKVIYTQAHTQSSAANEPRESEREKERLSSTIREINISLVERLD